jgi:hypothetical protein
MAGDKKGKGKVVEQPKKKKRPREEREWDRAIAAAEAQDRPRCPVQIHEPLTGDSGTAAESDAQAVSVQGTPPLCRSGRTRTSAQTPPPPCSGPRTRGGTPPRLGDRSQLQLGDDSGADVQAEDDPQAEPPLVQLLDVRGLPGPKVKKLRVVSEETWFPSSRDVGVDRRFYTLL